MLGILRIPGILEILGLADRWPLEVPLEVPLEIPLEVRDHHRIFEKQSSGFGNAHLAQSRSRGQRDVNATKKAQMMMMMMMMTMMMMMMMMMMLVMKHNRNAQKNTQTNTLKDNRRGRLQFGRLNAEQRKAEQRINCGIPGSQTEYFLQSPCRRAKMEYVIN